MKKSLLIIICASVLSVLSGCDKESVSTGGGQPTGPTDEGGQTKAEYVIRQVLQSDPENVDGVDLYDKFDFFSTLKMILYVTDGDIVAMEFSNGNIPFYPYSFEVPEGKFDCEFDSTVEPNLLKIKGTDNVVARIDNGQIVVDFKLDCEKLNYRYTFRLEK